MAVTPGKAKGGSASFGGHEYWFCGAKCREKFIAAPESYVAPAPKPTAADTATIYTCPMHPEVRQRGPGSCPKCGMALEPLTPTADPEHNAELRDMTRRLIVAAVL